MVDEIKKPSSSVDSPIDLPSSHPNSKSFFRDEPLDTKPVDGDFIADKTQYAWQISENLVPFQMKNQISYSDGFKSPRIDIQKFKQLSTLEGLYLGSINALISISLILFSSIILLNILNLIPSGWLSIFLATCIAVLYFGLSYFSSFKTAQIISSWDDQPLRISKSNFLSFSFIQVIHVGLISAISVICMKLFFPSSDSISSPISIYVPSIVIILLVAFLSPTFRIAKILSLLRNTGTVQDFLDAIQFPKIGAKRTVEIIVLSYLIPASLILAIFSPASHMVSILLTSTIETKVAAWEYILILFVILLLAICLTFVNFVDVNTFYFYEQSIKSYIEPPSLNWVKKVGQYSNQDNEAGLSNYSNSSSNNEFESRDERCPACSAILVGGAEFCIDCGKKVVR
ncbi:MAG: hypothetical protein GOP50_06985 [Candidatus Heimdallarchaeota archaeon]|nr:hypothetical protein [Candidatus Heimdallarchaeota archaeon]